MTVVGISVLSIYQAIRNKKIPSSNCLIIKQPVISCYLLQPTADTFLWNIVQKMWESARLLACIPLPDLLTPTSLLQSGPENWYLDLDICIVKYLEPCCIVRYQEPCYSLTSTLKIPYFSITKLNWKYLHFAIYYWPLEQERKLNTDIFSSFVPLLFWLGQNSPS